VAALLDPQAAAYLARLDELGAPRYGEQPTPVVRAAMDDGAAALFGPFEPVPFEDRDLPGPAGAIPVRIYRPAAAAGTLVWFHGGGWALGSIRSSHPSCSALADLARCTVVSVDYRLAPEHPFPAAVDDAWAAFEWVAGNLDALGASGPVAVGGDSAGGNLSAVVALRARDRGVPIAAQLLVYPVTDADLERPSYVENATGYWLTSAGMAWFWDQYVPSGDRFHPDASPLRATSLAGTAPATIVIAEYDPLRDEGEAYAARLVEAGVPVRLHRYDGMIHGFFRVPAMIDRANEALADVAAAAREALDAGS
jgi:acetyl esterase